MHAVWFSCFINQRSIWSDDKLYNVSKLMSISPEFATNISQFCFLNNHFMFIIGWYWIHIYCEIQTMIVDHTVTTVCVLFYISMYTIPIQTHSSQYLTLRQTRCLKVVTHLKQLFLKSEYYSCAKPKNKTPQIKVETKLVCNSQEYSIQLRTVPSRFS